MGHVWLIGDKVGYWLLLAMPPVSWPNLCHTPLQRQVLVLVLATRDATLFLHLNSNHNFHNSIEIIEPLA
jgi:hypothetical protein